MYIKEITKLKNDGTANQIRNIARETFLEPPGSSEPWEHPPREGGPAPATLTFAGFSNTAKLLYQPSLPHSLSQQPLQGRLSGPSPSTPCHILPKIWRTPTQAIGSALRCPFLKKGSLITHDHPTPGLGRTPDSVTAFILVFNETWSESYVRLCFHRALWGSGRYLLCLPQDP